MHFWIRQKDIDFAKQCDKDGMVVLATTSFKGQIGTVRAWKGGKRVELLEGVAFPGDFCAVDNFKEAAQIIIDYKDGRYPEKKRYQDPPVKTKKR